MSDDKAQMSNQIQRSNEMPKQVRHDKNVILNLALKQVQGLRFQNPFLNLDIHLTFACLREAASAKAGILAFAIAFIKVVVCLFS
jgi:hypothetical protein